MSAHGRAKLAQYQSVSVHGGVAEADPHALVLMLFDATIERLNTARGCIERREIARKAKLLHSSVRLIAELRGSLNLKQGGALAQNLSNLYEYMTRRVLHANAFNDPRAIAEVLSLIGEIRSAWVAIGAEVRRSTQPSAPGVPGLAHQPPPKVGVIG